MPSFEKFSGRVVARIDLVPYPDAVWYQGQNAVVDIQEYRATRAVAWKRKREG